MEKKKKEYVRIIVLTICTLILMMSAIFSSPISSGIKKLLFKTGIKICDDELVVHFVDVGQGDASIITFPNGQTMMIDAGPKASQNILVEYIRDNVKHASKDFTIDYLLLTHPDTDHSGGMCAIFEQFDVKHFYRPNIASKSEDFNNFIGFTDINEYDQVINISQDEYGLKTSIINQNYDFNVGGARVEIFAPLRAYLTTNSMSPIVKISYLNQSLLFAGDIQMDAEADMITAYSSMLDADVLKVAHHGSDTSSSEQFIEAVSPKYGVISSADPNSYGQPSYSTVITLQKYNVEIIKTANNMVRFTLGDDGIELLNNEITISNVFIQWRVVAILISSVLIVIEGLLIVRLIRYNDRLTSEKDYTR